MIAEHDQEQSKDGVQVFWLSISGNDDTDTLAQFRAWLAIGRDDFGDVSELSSYKKAQWNIAYEQALQLEAMKLAYQSDEIRWLIKQDVKFDINPFANGWLPHVEDADVKLTVEGDDRIAMLFKLAHC